MKTITNPINLARPAADDYVKCYGPELVLSSMTLQMLEKSRYIQETWMKKRFSRPLFMDKEYIANSLDSFPIEFLSMKERYIVIFGEDVLKDLPIDAKYVRLQAERELKGKWLHLMQEWPSVKKHPKRLSGLIRVSMGDFSVIFRSLLYLKGLPIPPERMALFAAISSAFGLENRPLERTLEAFRSGNGKAMAAIFPDYSKAIRILSKSIDQLTLKETP